jgi:hypothetical protein
MYLSCTRPIPAPRESVQDECLTLMGVHVDGASRQVPTCLRSQVSWSAGAAVTERADGWIRWTTIGCVALLALIAGTVSYLHMHMLVALHGQPGWVAALRPVSVDGMLLAASATLLADSRSGRRGGVLPWALLVAGSVASLAGNVAVAEPSLIGQVIAAWPSFALAASFELLTRQVRRGAAGQDAHHDRRQCLRQGARTPTATRR